MGISLKLLTDLAQGKLTPEDALDSMLLPSMRKAGHLTLIIKVKPIIDGATKDSEFKIVQEYWTKDFDLHLEEIKNKMISLKQENDALKVEHRAVIDLYNDLLKKTSKKK